MAHDAAELLTATDAETDDAMAFADPLLLRGLPHQMTGDESLVDVELMSVIVAGSRTMYLVMNPTTSLAPGWPGRPS